MSAAAAAVAVSTVIGVLGNISGANEQKQQLENQAQALEGRADALEKEGFFQETSIRNQKDKYIGAQTASASGSGVQVSTGSVLDLIEDTAFNIEMDAMTTRTNYAKQATVLREEASMTRAAKPSGLSTLLGAGGTAASGYSQYKMFS